MASRKKESVPTGPDSSKSLVVRIDGKDITVSVHKGSKQYCKQFAGRRFYFGKVGDPTTASKRFADQWPRIIRGEDVSTRVLPAADFVTVEQACNSFLHDRRIKVESGELRERTWDDYRRSCHEVINFFGRTRSVEGLGPHDFANLRKHLSTAKDGSTVSLVTLAGRIAEARLIFNFAYDADLIDRPVKFGPGFKKPTRQKMDGERRAKGTRLFTPSQIHKVLDVVDDHIRAMTWLGINCAFGNGDIGRLEVRHIDLDRQWIHFPRPKTGVDRRCPIWDTTAAALATVIDARKQIDDGNGDLVFRTSKGKPWFQDSVANPLSREFRKVLQSAGVYEPGLSFYRLRHVFEVVAGESLDQPAVDKIMGHKPLVSDMAAHYRNGIISDERLVAVTEHVRQWLFTPGSKDD